MFFRIRYDNPVDCAINYEMFFCILAIDGLHLFFGGGGEEGRDKVRMGPRHDMYQRWNRVTQP